MVFSTPIFLFLFLPAVLVLNYIIPKKYIAAKNVVLLIASLFFYAWGEPKNVLLMLLSIAVNYVCGAGSTPTRKNARSSCGRLLSLTSDSCSSSSILTLSPADSFP